MKEIVFLSNEDYYEVRLGSMLASYDRDIITTLYQPIIGYTAMALYFTLWSESKYNDFNSLVKHISLCKKMGIEIDALFNSRQKLEAIGLLKTYKKKLVKSKYSFIYELYAPKSPSEFFNDIIYKGLLSKAIGEREVKRLSIIYSSKNTLEDEKDNVSAQFTDIYNVDEDETMKVINIKSARGRKTIQISSSFDQGNFLKEIKTVSQILPSSFLKEDLVEISRIATLFGFDIVTMVDIVTRSYHQDRDNHLDYKELFEYASKMKQGVKILEINNEIKEYNDDDKFGQILNEFNEYSPYEFLRLKQNYTTPSPSDIKIINTLSEKYNLAPSVINVVVDYTLKRCNDTLSSAYAEKIATTLVRKNITTALAACNALLNNRKTSKKVNEEVEIKKDNSVVDISKEELLKELEEL